MARQWLTVAVQPSRRQHMRCDPVVKGRERRRAGADLVGEGGEPELDALAGVALGLPVQRLVLAKLLEQDRRQQVRPCQPRGVGWNGAGGCVMRSQSRQLNFPGTVWTTFHWRGITSTVSVFGVAPVGALAPHPRRA